MPTPWPVFALALVLGLLVGSFVNVVVYRVPRHESVLFPPSHCPGCGAAIKKRHNIPVVGWLVLRGRCAGCAGRISPRYPLVEAITGLTYVALTMRFGVSAALPAYLFLATVGIALALIDADGHRMPTTILMPSYVVGAALLTLASVAEGNTQTLLRACVGAVALAMTQLLFVMELPFGGAGRIQLAGLLGLFLGWLGWPALLVGIVAAIGTCGAVETVRSARNHAESSFTIALAPPMVMAAGVALFVTTPLVHWYGSLIGTA